MPTTALRGTEYKLIELVGGYGSKCNETFGKPCVSKKKKKDSQIDEVEHLVEGKKRRIILKHLTLYLSGQK